MILWVEFDHLKNKMLCMFRIMETLVLNLLPRNVAKMKKWKQHLVVAKVCIANVKFIQKPVSVAN